MLCCQKLIKISKINYKKKLQASPVEGQSLQQKEKKRRKRKSEKKIPKIEKPKNVPVGGFLVQKLNLKILISAHAQVTTCLKPRC